MGKILHAIKEISSFISVVIVLSILITSFVVMFYGIGYIAPYMHEKYFYIPIFILVPVPLLLLLLVDMAAYIWYLFLVVVISSCMLIFLYRGLPAYFNKISKEPLSYKTNEIQELAEIYSMLLFLNVIIVLIMHIFAVKTPTIGIEKIPLYSQMLQLLHASVYEEIVTRLVFLGIPVYIWHLLASTQRDGEKLKIWRIFGGGYEFGVPELTFTLVSATIFGIAHTPAWGWWKFFPTFIAGIAMAYLYLKYGIHMTILLHFTTDFMTIPMAMNTKVYMVFGLMFMLLIILGIVFTISYSIRILQHFGMRKKQTRKFAPTPSPPWIKLKCPNCGGQEFKYLGDGKLQCIRCGTIIDEYQEQSHQSPEQGFLPPPPP